LFGRKVYKPREEPAEADRLGKLRSKCPWEVNTVTSFGT